jgi:RecA-family ATPase
VSFYCTLYKDKYGKQPVVNKYREKWGMLDVLETVEYDRAKTLLEYYFHVNKPGHPLNWFFYNFDKLDDSLRKKDADKKHRDMLRLQTKQMVEESTF